MVKYWNTIHEEKNNQSNEITGIGIYVGETILANNSHSMA